MVNIYELIKLIQVWADKRGLLYAPNPFRQLNQLSEEVGELTSDLMDGKTQAALMELGDNIVVLIILSTQLGVCAEIDWDVEELASGTIEENLLSLSICNGILHSVVKKGKVDLYNESIRTMLYYLSSLAEHNDVNLVYCLKLAYDKIKNRKGKNIDGQFIKQKDSQSYVEKQ